MLTDFFKKRSKQTIFGIFLSLLERQVRDSKTAYIWICLILLLFSLFSLCAFQWKTEYFFVTVDTILKQGDSIFSLFPPFLLTIVAIFPAFSEKAKTKLRELKSNGEPRVAAFLDQFVFLVLLSLFLLVFSKVLVASAIFEKKSVQAMSGDQCFWYLIFANIYLFLFLSLFWEILDSIKSLYILILREYFEE